MPAPLIAWSSLLDWKSHELSSVSALLIAVFILNYLNKSFSRQQRPPLPPGPKGLPLIGNALDLPKSEEWVMANEWMKQYGEFPRNSKSNDTYSISLQEALSILRL
jgi:hypothetical protein